MKNRRTTLLGILLIGIIISSISIYSIESQKRILDLELIELSNVKYGLFNVDEWKAALSEILVKRINEFEVDPTKEEELREKISNFLSTAIDELEKSFFEKNSGSLKGFLKGSIANITDVYGVMRKDIPLITESILDFVKDPENKELAKDFLLTKMDEYSEKTFSEIDYSIYDEILAKHHASSKQEAIVIIKNKVSKLVELRTPYSIAIFSMVILLFIGVSFSKNFVPLELLLLSITCAVLLLVGLLLPMINIDARISKMEFQLMGETILFTDQVLYFKSKSILEVVRLMLSNSKPDVFLVGALVFAFSVLFPISKLIASIIYLYSEKAKQHSLVEFLVFKISKWSMADVMVIAIFMAFIGFSGIISDQLTGLENITTRVEIMTTNASSLQIGFFLFTSFAVLSLLVSHKLKFSPSPTHENSP